MNKKSCGFTLLEVMVALVMIAIAFSAIYLSLSTSTRTQSALQDKTAANWVGLNVIARKQIGVIPNQQSNGQERMLLENWKWESKTEKTANASIMTIEVKVSKEKGPVAAHLIGYLINRSSAS